MTETTVGVNPSTNPEKIDIATETTDSRVFPVYLLADSGGNLIKDSNGTYVSMSLDDLDRNTMLLDSVARLETQMKIFNMYMAEGFDFTLTEEDVEDAD